MKFLLPKKQNLLTFLRMCFSTEIVGILVHSVKILMHQKHFYLSAWNAGCVLQRPTKYPRHTFFKCFEGEAVCLHKLYFLSFESFRIRCRAALACLHSCAFACCYMRLCTSKLPTVCTLAPGSSAGGLFTLFPVFPARKHLHRLCTVHSC